MPASKPSETIKLVKEICNKVSNGASIRAVLAQSHKYPSFSTWCEWLNDNQELANLYACSREIRHNLVVYGSR